MFKRIHIYVFSLIFTLASATSISFAARKKDYLSDALVKYQTSSGVEARVTKMTTVKIIDQKVTSVGGFIMGLKQLRMDFIKPDNQTLVINNDSVWFQNDLTELGGGIQVSKTSLKKAYQSSNGLLAVLLGHEHFMSTMKVKSKTNKDNTLTYNLVPKSKTAVNIEKTQIIIKKEPLEILELNYWDASGNQTSYIFSKTKFNKKFAQNRFDYQPPKGADVTEF